MSARGFLRLGQREASAKKEKARRDSVARVSSCHGKQRLTMDLAKHAIRTMRNHRNERGLVAYKCKYCDAWHVGSAQKKRKLLEE